MALSRFYTSAVYLPPSTLSRWGMRIMVRWSVGDGGCDYVFPPGPGFVGPRFFFGIRLQYLNPPVSELVFDCSID